MKSHRGYMLKPIIALICVILVIGLLLFSLGKLNSLEAQKKFISSGQSPTNTIPLVTAKDYIEGNPKAKVTLVEYSDFECPSC